MRRTFAILLAILLLAVGTPAAPAVAETPPAEPACADITGDSGQSYYVVDGPGNTPGEAILSIYITTREPLCADATLTVHMSINGTNFTASAYPGDSRFVSCGASCLTFTNSYGSTAKKRTSTAPATLYVYIETSRGGGVVDSAPDTGAGQFLLCDFDPKPPKNYDDTGTVIPPCNPPGGNYFE